MAKNDREFYIETPLGLLKVFSKHDVDLSLDYPGVNIDLIREGEDDLPLATVEYESTKDHIQTVVYAEISREDPTDIIPHNIEIK